MPRDVNLQLDSAAVHAAGTTQSTVVNTEGGKFAFVNLTLVDISTTSDTLDTTIQASIDGGSTWFSIGAFPQFNDAEDELLNISRPVYVPQPAAGQTLTKVRLNHVVSAGGSATITAFLEPLLSLAPNATDERLGAGFAALT